MVFGSPFRKRIVLNGDILYSGDQCLLGMVEIEASSA